ncbi:bifunctional folylpolyglutamate synthase/dihydrofolate synthase [Bariatricus sp. SGI.154]|uniref:bifunctional folylpolyglutamate synthase/dihydrofolate synthase n=1 Tax=Bariatricus sp. SGI.154 TaxID=3420549 RepID=UPI003CFDC17F
MTYKEARVYLDKVSKYGSVLGLDTIRALLCELGNPQESLKFIHIAGTNGKGSVLAYTSTILSEAGYRTGRYVSPTVVSYLERIQVDGEWIPEDAFARLTEIVQKAIARMEAAGKPSPTVFEVETAIAFLYFRETNCDIVVLECGLGGELDATNIIENTVCAVFTSISRDHLGILGNTLEEIAQTKSGIIKPGCTVITTTQQPEVMQVLKDRAKRLSCPLFVADKQYATVSQEGFAGQTISYKDYEKFHCPLAGRYQLDNAVLALEIMRILPTLGYPLSQESIRLGLEKTAWPGRFTCLMKKPLFFIDGAHNEDAARRLRESVETYFPGKRLIFIMGVFRDKEYEKIAAIMAPLAKSVYTVNLPDENRTLPAEELTRVMQHYCPGDVPVQSEQSIQGAVHHALSEAGSEDIILSFGSLSYLGQIMETVSKC